MQITREGNSGSRGKKQTMLPTAPLIKSSPKHYYDENVSWNSEEKQIKIRCTIPSPDHKNVNHDYTIMLSLDDLKAIIGALGDAGTESNPTEIRDALKSEIAGIVRLLACVHSVKPSPMSPSAVGDE